ncbi:MAG: GMC family oxidoreductase [Bryobacteraceae bacterium]|nr:GMC family oxidoreductase [Bryobacteraceae bacterium]
MPKTFSAVIVGSGASGGMAAWVLTRAGIDCCVLEAGPLVDFERQRELRPVYELPFRGFGTPGRFPHVTQASEFDENLWLDEKQNPYSHPANDPYFWVRIRMAGGKMNRWGRASWRLSDLEFKARDHDGFGENWPVEYATLAPYYSRVEPMFKVQGRNEGLPQLPDGVLLEDGSPDSPANARFIAAAAKRGIRITKPRRATGTLASSLNLLLPDAAATGKLTLVPNAIAREIAFDAKTGRVNGIHYLDRRSKRDFFIGAKAVVLGASTLETVRLLLNSASPRWPQGLGNASGTLGRYLFDQIYVKNVVQALVPEARASRQGRSQTGGAGYICRFRNVEKSEKLPFLRGYTYDFGSGGAVNPRYIPKYGEPLMREIADLGSASFSLTTMGEVLPRYENRASIHPTLKDDWGIPALHIEHRYTANERAMAKDSMEVASELCRDAGFEILEAHSQMVPPGESIHELGGCRMGADRKTSMLDQWQQSHEIPNLFAMDGSTFVTGGAQNPTLTILALAMRSSERLAERMKSGEL